MHLTRYTDYALRVLMYVGARSAEDGTAVATIGQIAGAYGISRDHLMKVAQELGKAGYLKTVRGRFGGLTLARPAAEIGVGEVVRHMEADFDLVDCGSCVIEPVCGLNGALRAALAAFMAVLDTYTLADLLTKRGDMLALFAADAGPQAPPPATREN